MLKNPFRKKPSKFEIQIDILKERDAKHAVMIEDLQKSIIELDIDLEHFKETVIARQVEDALSEVEQDDLISYNAISLLDTGNSLDFCIKLFGGFMTISIICGLIFWGVSSGN